MCYNGGRGGIGGGGPGLAHSDGIKCVLVQHPREQGGGRARWDWTRTVDDLVRGTPDGRDGRSRESWTGGRTEVTLPSDRSAPEGKLLVRSQCCLHCTTKKIKIKKYFSWSQLGVWETLRSGRPGSVVGERDLSLRGAPPHRGGSEVPGGGVVSQVECELTCWVG